MKQFSMPAKPSYYIRDGLPVYMVEAQHHGTRKGLLRDVLFVIHDTGGRDSRQELYDSPRRVSVHYLVGKYDTNPRPVVIKFMSEAAGVAWGAGYGSMGGIQGGINANAVQFEIEQHGMDVETFDAYAATIGQSLRIWRGFGCNVIFIPHRAIDKRKSDPRLDWNGLMERVYKYSREY